MAGGVAATGILVAAGFLAEPGAPSPRTPSSPPHTPGTATPSSHSTAKPHHYVGLWVTADGFIRQELLPNGRYDEARGNRQSAYTGSYTVTGNHLDYVDDTGFTATGDIRDGVLYHEHLVLFREGQVPASARK